MTRWERVCWEWTWVALAVCELFVDRLHRWRLDLIHRLNEMDKQEAQSWTRER